MDKNNHEKIIKLLTKNEEEREAGLAPYRRQIMTEQKNLACIRSVNLEEYWKGV